MVPRRKSLWAVLAVSTLLTWGCQSNPMKPITTKDYVDLDRFMGDWYVIAHIPTFLEKQAFNALESYALDDAGHVRTTFAFNEGALDGARKVYHPKGFVTSDPSNAIWKMQFLWPFKADYRVVYVDEAYEFTIVGREARDYVWIMARNAQVSEQVYDGLVARVESEGYSIADLRKVPHTL